MMKLLLLLGLTFYASAYFKVQMERGVDNSVRWASPPFHILQIGSGVPRSVDSDVSFTARFIQVPTVVLGSFILDLSSGQPFGYDIQLLFVTQNGFRVRYTALTPRSINGISINWFAFFDPNVQTIQFNASNSTSLSSGISSQRFQDYTINFTKPFDAPPTVALFLMGIQVLVRNNVLSLNARDITKNGFTLRVNTWYTSVVTFFRASIVAAPPSTLFAQKVFFRVPDYLHPWATRNPPQERGLVFTNPITDVKFQTGERFEFYGFSGYDQDDYNNVRTFVRNFEVSKTAITGSWGTWWDSALYQLEINYFLYMPDLTQKMYDPSCAEIYSECNYTGDSVSVCDRVNSFPKSGWNKPVKSYFIPPNKALKIYNLENLNGKLLRFEKSEPCVDVFRFNFAQILGLHEKDEELEVKAE